MRVGDWFERVDRAIGRFNRWFGPSAVAANTEQGRIINAMDVKVLQGELEQPAQQRDAEKKP